MKKMKSIKATMIYMALLSPVLVWGESNPCPCPGEQPYAGKDACGNHVCDPEMVGKYPDSAYDCNGDGEKDTCPGDMYTDACGNTVCEEPPEDQGCCGDETFDSSTECCVGGVIEPKYTGANPCSPAVIPSSTHMANGTQNIPAFNQTVVVTMVPQRQKLFRMNAGTFSNRTFNVFPKVHNSKQSSSCGGGIPTEILNPGSFSVSVGASIGFLSVGMSWSGGGTSFPIYDKSDADPEADVWKFGTSYEIEEKPNGARITITGTEELLYSPYTISQVNYQNHVVLFPNASKETQTYDYRTCSMCCE